MIWKVDYVAIVQSFKWGRQRVADRVTFGFTSGWTRVLVGRINKYETPHDYSSGYVLTNLVYEPLMRSLMGSLQGLEGLPEGSDFPTPVYAPFTKTTIRFSFDHRFGWSWYHREGHSKLPTIIVNIFLNSHCRFVKSMIPVVSLISDFIYVDLLFCLVTWLVLHIFWYNLPHI